MSRNPRLIDMTGYRISKITVKEKAGNNKRGAALWVCICDCGKESVNTGSDIRKGKVTSCGCISKERIGNLNRSHSMTKQRIYNTWQNMKARCFNKKRNSYKNYGERGITVCKEWLKFENFNEWAKESGYEESLTIERIDVNGNYCPENCTWIPHGEQSYNRNYTLKNESGELWLHVAVKNGISKQAFRNRIRDGWSFEEASTHPHRKRRTPRKRDEKGRFI